MGKQMAGEEITVVGMALGFNAGKRGIENFLGSVEETLQKHVNEPVIVLFPEAVLGTTPIPEKTAKAIAGQIHQMAKAHGQAHVAYSVIEASKNLRKEQVLSNAGYFVVPKKRFTGAVYKRHVSKENRSTGVKWETRALRIPKIPIIKIRGKKVGLAICSSAEFGPDAEWKRKKTQVDLLLVPAGRMTINRHYAGRLKERLTPTGTAVIVQSNFAGMHVIDRKQNSVGYVLHKVKIPFNRARKPATRKAVHPRPKSTRPRHGGRRPR